MYSTNVYDSILIERIHKGDRAAIDALLEKYRARAYQYALKLTKHSEDASDILADTFVRVYNAIGRFEHGCSFSTWLYRILKNCFLDSLKKRQVKIAASLDQGMEMDDGALYMQVIDEKNDVNDIVFTHAFRDKVRQSISKLTPIQAEMVTKYHIDERTYEDISQSLGVPVGTIKSRLSRARITLRDIVSSENDPLITDRLRVNQNLN